MDHDIETRQFRETKEFYAKLLVALSRSGDARLERAFASVPREAFLPPGPWKIFVGDLKHNSYIETPSDDPIHVYKNALIALVEDEGLNNGQPSLHALWMAAVAPRAGETVVHIGAGTGYYSAVLSMLTLPGGCVKAFEINEELAATACENLARYNNVTTVAADATSCEFPDADVIYVNAGVKSPPEQWLHALRPGGRLIFPWRPSDAVGEAVIVTRKPGGYGLRCLGPAYFISCLGASDVETVGTIPDLDAVRRTRSVCLTSKEKPDETATAIYNDIWFSADVP